MSMHAFACISVYSYGLVHGYALLQGLSLLLLATNHHFDVGFLLADEWPVSRENNRHIDLAKNIWKKKETGTA